MKLCIVGNPNSVHTRRMVKYISQMGVDIHLIGEHALQRPPPNHCSFYNLAIINNIRKVRYIFWIQAVRRLIKRIEPDILHAISVTSAGWLAAAANHHPFIISAIGSDLMLLEQRPILNRTISKWALRQADYVTCVSRDIAIRANQLGIEANRIEIIYTGVDLQIFNQNREGKDIRAAKRLKDEPIVLSIRAMNPIYRPLDIAKAIPIVLRDIPDVKFAIMTYNSDSITLKTFKSIIDSHNATEAVIYIEPLSEDRTIAEYYSAADVAVSVPSSDGTPLSVLEAMACGTAVIASNLPSILDWIVPNQNGLIVPIGDVNELANAIIRLVQDPLFRNRLGANAAIKIKQQGDQQIWLRRIMDIYHEITI